jgi:carbamoyltransferase
VAKVLGVNAVFHDPAAALIVDGHTVAAAEEERFSRRKHGKTPVPFSTWELPEAAARWCLSEAGIDAAELDAVAYSYRPEPTDLTTDVMADNWEALRTLFVRRAPRFLQTALPGLRPERVRFVAHHRAHAASAYLAAPFDDCAVMVADGRGERSSYLAGHAVGGRLEVLQSVDLPNSLGLFYEEATEHLGFRRSSDEYKVMALAAYGEPRFAAKLRDRVHCTGDGAFVTRTIDWEEFTRPGAGEDGWTYADADLAASVQRVLEEALLELAGWLHRRTGSSAIVLAGGVALNCVANSRVARESAFDDVWVQPAAGDAGTALGAALHVARTLGDHIEPFHTAALGRAWDDVALGQILSTAAVPFTRPDDMADEVAQIIAEDGIVAWVQGRSEWGPRALGHRSLLANPRRSENLARLNDIKGREQFRPVAPMVLLERAAEIFDGPMPSPYMLFTHEVRPAWRSRIPAVVHVDGTARIQTVDSADEPLLARMLRALDRRTGVPVCVNTSLNTAGRPMVDAPRDALECFGSSPIDALAIGPYLIRRAATAARGSEAAA